MAGVHGPYIAMYIFFRVNREILRHVITNYETELFEIMNQFSKITFCCFTIAE